MMSAVDDLSNPDRKHIYFVYDIACNGLLRLTAKEVKMLGFGLPNSLLELHVLKGFLKRRVEFVHVMTSQGVIRLEPHEVAGRNHYSSNTGKILGKYQKIVLLSGKFSGFGK